MDPFSPMNPNQKVLLENMLVDVHQQFKTDVMQGRGKRLSTDPDVFSGLFWTGNRAKALGLIDGFGSAGSVARDVIKVPRLVDYTSRPNYLERFARKIGLAFSNQMLNALGIQSSGIKSRI